MKNFLLDDSSELLAVRLFSGLPSPKTCDSYFLDKVYVVCMKNFLLADSSELMVVRLISASWAQKRWFLVSRHDLRRVDEKFSSRRFGRADGVRLISASWGQIRLILTFWTWFTSSWWKIFLSPIRASWWLLDSFRPPEPKNVWFLLFWNDVRRVDEKFSSRWFERTFGC